MSAYDTTSSPADLGGAAPSHANPTVSKSQWANFALGKLREGFVLLQSPNGKVFQFYKSGMPLQPCAAHAAKKLLAMGMLGVAKTDIRGTHYALPDAFQPEAVPSA
jgi:hypothetical protein